MLRLHTGTSAYGIKNYFRQSDYYASEAVGRWGGRLAAELGLAGPVAMADFDKMTDNVNPATGERLTLRTRENRRIGATEPERTNLVSTPRTRYLEGVPSLPGGDPTARKTSPGAPGMNPDFSDP